MDLQLNFIINEKEDWIISETLHCWTVYYYLNEIYSVEWQQWFFKTHEYRICHRNKELMFFSVYSSTIEFKCHLLHVSWISYHRHLEIRKCYQKSYQEIQVIARNLDDWKVLIFKLLQERMWRYFQVMISWNERMKNWKLLNLSHCVCNDCVSYY